MRLILFVTLVLSCRASPHDDPHFVQNHDAILQLFEWRYDDIAEECETFLGPFGYGAVQISPPFENAVIDQPWYNNNVRRPWWERYQPISYNLVSRSGDEEALRSMVERCNNAGVRIIVDVVLNHMSGDLGQGRGVGGTYFDTKQYSFPGVPYERHNFNSKGKCGTGSGSIERYEDSHQVRNCMLAGLLDLDQSQEYVRQKMIDVLNKLIDMGVVGFRVDAAKHMWPGDLEAIFSRLKNLNTEHFSENSRPFILNEIVYFGGGGANPHEYVNVGRVTEMRFMDALNRAFLKRDSSITQLRHKLGNMGLVSSGHAVSMNENHDSVRGEVGDIHNVISYRRSRLHKMVTGFLLAYDYGIPTFTSNYEWPQYIEGNKDINYWVGPPANPDWSIKRVQRNADKTCGNGWVCEHRWRQIYQMVRFRIVVKNEPISHWWSQGDHRIAFSRGRKGFVAINNENHDMKERIQTGMPAGTYCNIISGTLQVSTDVISGRVDHNSCSGASVTVSQDGWADIFIPGAHNHNSDGILAIHMRSKLH